MSYQKGYCWWNLKTYLREGPQLPWTLAGWTGPEIRSLQKHWPHLFSWEQFTRFTELLGQWNELIWWIPFTSASLDHREEEVMVYSTSRYPKKESEFSISKSARNTLPLGHMSLSSVHTPIGKISPPCWVNFLSATGAAPLAPAYPACLNFVCFSLKKSFAIYSLPNQILSSLPW